MFAFARVPPNRAEISGIGSHRWMRAELESIAASTADESPFLQERRFFELRMQLRDPQRGRAPSTRCKMLLECGREALQLGRMDAATSLLQEAVEFLPRLTPTERMQLERAVLLQASLAWLRKGEVENCLDCHNPERCIFPIQGQGQHQRPEGSRRAIELLMRLHRTEPRDPTARWLLNIAHMTLGEYPHGVPPELLIPPSRFASEADFPRFRDVARSRGLSTSSLCGGAVIEDFDNDGRLDVVTSSWDPRESLRYFQQAADGRFVERTAVAQLDQIHGGLNLIQADYDNDGWTDLYVMRGAWLRDHGRHPNSLLRNLGDGTFQDVTLQAGLAEPRAPSQTASFGDYDLDGDLDLYVGNESDPENPHPCQLFQNLGDGTFENVTEQAGVANLRYTKGVVFGDYDNDGDPDLFVANLGAANRLYRNNGDGTFFDAAREAGVALPRQGFSTWFFDYDNDGNLDLYVGTYNPGDPLRTEVSYVAASYLGVPTPAETGRLYRGNGYGSFVNQTEAAGLSRLSIVMGANFGDLNNDGYLDFYLGTGYPGYEGLMPNVMYLNQGGRRFADVTTAGGFGHLQKGHGVAFADLDNDGDQDVFEQLGGAFAGDRARDVLFENPGFGNHWITLRLRGVRSNRSAIGARLKLEFRDGEQARTVHRRVNSGGSFGASPLRQEIGLGKARQVDRLEVFWPVTGETQVFENLPVDQFLEIVEGRGL